MGIFIDKKTKFLIIGCSIIMFGMILKSEIVVAGVNNAISVFFNNVFPIIFPFTIVANILSDVLYCSNLYGKHFHFIISGLGGYPLAAMLISNLVKGTKVSQRTQLNLLALSFVTSPGFIIGTVGYTFLNDKYGSIILLICHYIGALINSLIFDSKEHLMPYKSINNVPSIDLKRITDIIYNTLKSMAIIFGFIVIFMIITGFVDELILKNIVINLWGNALIKGILEITIGCSQLSALNLSYPFKLALLNFVISFGGFSIILQASSILNNTDISFKEVVLVKVSHGIIAFILTFILSSFMLK